MTKKETYNDNLYELDTLLDDVLDDFYASNLNNVEKEDPIIELEDFNDWFINNEIFKF